MGSADETVQRLALRPPIAWEPLLAWLAARAIPGVETVAGGRYARTTATGTATLAPAAGGGAVELRATGADPDGDARRARHLADLEADPEAIDAALARDPLLAPHVAALPGLRVPGCWDGFELGVRAILGQQVSVAAASRLAGRVVAEHGEPLPRPDGALTHRFPAPEALADAPLPFMPAQRSRAIRALAAATAGGDLDLSAGADPALARERLLALPGIGPWTAEYVAMRALHDPDAFPAGDLVLRRALGDDPGRAERWRPLRAYAAMRLWSAAASAAGGAGGSGTTASGARAGAAGATGAGGATAAATAGARRVRSHQASSSTTSATTTGTVAG
ncbi:MAG TPA: AlkA N-terminal domain-containing protein [Capillimicrobium sp.]|nr:AlkA N-terminal domain-containing protein [Capillimicrobium sp.]